MIFTSLSLTLSLSLFLSLSLSLSLTLSPLDVRTTGRLGIFLFDSRGGKLLSSGKQGKDSALVSDKQWRDLDRFLEGPSLCCVVVITERPVIEESRDEAQGLSSYTPHLVDRWSCNPVDQGTLLAKLFEWKALAAGREVKIVGGATGCPFKTTIGKSGTKA